jgi:hypothetical protein
MIRVLKQFGFVITCGLFIPFSALMSSIWITMSVTSSTIGYIMIPVEYILTGHTKYCNRLMNYFWYHLPKLYDDQIELFFKFIHPDNEIKFK